ncbi:MAG: GAF domain-containing protein, partial [Candidatus Latescibacterota bacterium]
QPVAIADAAQDPRFARDIGQAIGYVPRTILCVPLYLKGSVIGVLELLDKEGGVPFSAGDLDLLARFANLAALALDQSRLMHDLRPLFRMLLADVVPPEAAGESLTGFADRAADLADGTAVLALARLVHDIGQQGGGRQLALEVLASVARYLKTSGGAPA